MKLSDADVKRLRALAAEGVPLADLADDFGISPQHAGRLVRHEQRAELDAAETATADAVDDYLDGRERDGAGDVVAEVARALAEKLDACRASTSAAAAHAAPSVARELLDVIDRLDAAVRPPDALDQIVARRKARLAGLPVDAPATTRPVDRGPKCL